MGQPVLELIYYPPEITISPEEQMTIPTDFDINTENSYIRATVYTNSLGEFSMDPNIEFVIPSEGLVCFGNYIQSQKTGDQ